VAAALYPLGYPIRAEFTSLVAIRAAQRATESVSVDPTRLPQSIALARNTSGIDFQG